MDLGHRPQQFSRGPCGCVRLDLFAAGTFTSANGVAANQIAKWDGNNWSSVSGSVVGSGTVLSLTTMGNNLYAGGTFTNIGGATADRIAGREHDREIARQGRSAAEHAGIGVKSQPRWQWGAV